MHKRETLVCITRPRCDINGESVTEVTGTSKRHAQIADDDVYYYIRWRPKLEGETENMGVCTKERKGVTAEVLMATPCTNSLMMMMMFITIIARD